MISPSRFLRAAAVTGVISTCAVIVAWHAGVRYNVTSSWPRGFWRVCGASWSKGDIVLVEVPPSGEIFRAARARGYLRAGLFNGGSVPMLKRVVAVAGDLVDVNVGVAVGGQLLPNSTLLRIDSAGRALPHEATSGVVPIGYVWIMSEHSAASFDSRYFGAVPASLIRGKAQPLWTW